MFLTRTFIKKTNQNGANGLAGLDGMLFPALRQYLNV
jgi:hypothetical protein